VPTVTAPTERLIRRIRQDFGRGADDEVIRRLTALAADDSSERIQAALVLGAGGDWERFEQQLRLLELDWRDVLVAGGLAGDDWPVRLAAELPAIDQDNPSRSDARRDRKPRAARRQTRAPRRDPRRGGGRHRRSC
jgi:hypothetical protein